MNQFKDLNTVHHLTAIIAISQQRGCKQRRTVDATATATSSGRVASQAGAETSPSPPRVDELDVAELTPQSLVTKRTSFWMCCVGSREYEKKVSFVRSTCWNKDRYRASASSWKPTIHSVTQINVRQTAMLGYVHVVAIDLLGGMPRARTTAWS